MSMASAMPQLQPDKNQAQKNLSGSVVAGGGKQQSR